MARDVAPASSARSASSVSVNSPSFLSESWINSDRSLVNLSAAAH